MINEDEEGDLMRDEERENKRLEDLEYQEECKNERDKDNQDRFDSGMVGSDFL